MAKWLKLSATYTFFLPNLRYCTALLHLDVPNCHTGIYYLYHNIWRLNYRSVNGNMAYLTEQLVLRHISSTVSEFMLEMCPAWTDTSP